MTYFSAVEYAHLRGGKHLDFPPTSKTRFNASRLHALKRSFSVFMNSITKLRVN